MSSFHPTAGPRRATRIALAAALAAGALAPAGALAQAPAGTLVVEARDNPDFLDPALAFSEESWQILANTGDGLMAFRRVAGPAGAEVVPDLAAAPPVVTDGGRTYTFTMRADARFGPPLDRAVLPSDVKASLERLFMIDSRGASLYDGIVGADDMAAGRATSLAGVTADDAGRRLVIRLTKPDPDLPTLLALPFAFVMPRGTPAVDQSARPPVATGPYYIVRYDPDRRIELARNPNFSPRGTEVQAGGPDRIVVQIGGTLEESAHLVAEGDADYVQAEVPPRWANAGGQAAGARVRRSVAASTWYVALDARRRPFNDARVRQALALVMEPRKAAGLLTGTTIPTAQTLPPVTPGFRRLPIPSAERLAQARALVRRARARGVGLTVVARAGGGQEAVARYLAGLMNRIGLRATTQSLPDGSGLPAVAGTQAPRGTIAAVARWDQVVPDGEDAFGWLLGHPGLGTPAAPVPARTGTAALVALARTAAALPAGPARSAAWAAVDRAAAGGSSALPFANPVRVELTSPRVRGWVAHPVFGFLWMRAALAS